MGVIPEQNSVNTLVRISNRTFSGGMLIAHFSFWAKNHFQIGASLSDWLLVIIWNRNKARVSSQENLKQKKLFRQGSLQKLAVGWKQLIHQHSHCRKTLANQHQFQHSFACHVVFDWWFLLVDFLTNQNDLDYSLRLIENKSISLL